ncbi:MAG: hypothetical protein U1E11_02210 [Dethiobacteria bacterium]|nr:hypothetical protein [Dethiobacteria bacterium]
MFKRNNWFLFFTMAMLLAALLLVSGCGGSDEASNAATEAEAEAPDAGTEEPAAEPEADPQPAGDCPAATSVTVESTNGAYADREPISWDTLGSQAAYVNRSTGNVGVSVCIANFETSENLKTVALGNGQAVIVFSMRVRAEGPAVPIQTGIYDLLSFDDSDLYVAPTIRLSGGSTLQISIHNLNEAEFEITSVTDEEICGKFTIDEKWTKMSGEFRVPFE